MTRAALPRKSASFRFIGANIKGTPAMSRRKVARDLRTLKPRADVVALQEFKWPWYWAVLKSFTLWRTYPGARKASKRPAWAAQALMWRRRKFRALDARTELLHPSAGTMTMARYLRAVLLEDRKAPGLAAWFVTTHFVVGGDQPGDPERRQAFLARDLFVLRIFLVRLKQTGWPVVLELDANIVANGSSAHRSLLRIVADLGGTIHGRHGVEYLVTFDGKRAHIVPEAEAWTVPVARLNTDHEARGLTFHIALAGN